MPRDGVTNATIGGCQEVLEYYAGLAVGVAPLLRGFEANLRDLKYGHMPKISNIPLKIEDIQNPKVLNLQTDPHEGMNDLMGRMELLKKR